MKKISAVTLSFTFTGCFLGAGYVSGQELYQFFGAFGGWGIIGLFAAVAILGALNLALIRIVSRTSDARIDHVVVGGEHKTLLFLVGALEMVVFFGTYVVMAAGAGALVKTLTGFRGAHIWGGLLFCAVISFIAVRGITGLVHIFSGVVPILVVLTLAVGTAAVCVYGGNGLDFRASDSFNPLIPNFAAGAVTFASYNLFCSIGVLCPVGLAVKNRRCAVLGTAFGCVMLLLVAFSVLFALAALPDAAGEALPMLAAARRLSPLLMYVYAALLFLAMSGASLACLIPTVTYFSEYFRWAQMHGAVVTFAISGVAFLLSCFGFADLVGTVFSSFGYLALLAVFGILRHAAIVGKPRGNLRGTGGKKS
ncbi:MAG: hypothetical protein ACI4RV_06855 [Eubacteriales bacterium]